MGNDLIGFEINPLKDSIFNLLYKEVQFTIFSLIFSTCEYSHYISSHGRQASEMILGHLIFIFVIKIKI